MRSNSLAPVTVLNALERFAPQARPYNFDDMFDCWGFQRRLFDWIDDGFELNDELEPGREGLWQRFTGAGDRPQARAGAGEDDLPVPLPGDILVSHPHPDAAFHTVIYAGRFAGLDLVYDTSSRGRVPLFEGERLVTERPLYTRFMRASETTDRLRHDGGAYLRLWDDRVRYLHVGLHGRLAAGDPAGERDLVSLRRAAGLSDLPFYCRQKLPVDVRGRELYDNRETRALDYYTPDGAALEDDAYEAAGWAEGRGAPGEAQSLRPAPPALDGLPHRVLREGDWTVSWRPAAEAPSRREGTWGSDVAVTSPETRGAPVLDGWRVELWEETADLWKHRLLRLDVGPDCTRFTPPRDLLREGGRFAVVLFAHDARGWSGSALATALWRPEAGHPLLGYNAVRPRGLSPDLLEVVRPEGEALELRWSIQERVLTQAGARVRLFADACLADDEPPLLDLDLDADEAAACRCRIPAALLRGGHTYAWYVDARDATGRWTFAPSEGVFAVE